MKKHGFLGIVVVGTLIYVVISVAVFTVLQIHFGIDPSPHYEFLRIAVPVELATSGVIEIVKSIQWDKKARIVSNDDDADISIDNFTEWEG